MLGFDWSLASDQTTVGTFILDLVMAVILAWGVLRGLPRLFNHLAVLADRNRLREEVKALQATIAAQGQGLAAFEAVRRELDRVNDRLDEVEELALASADYNVVLIEHLRSGGTADTMPAIPERLRGELLERLRARPHHSEARRSAGPSSSSETP